MEKRPLDVTILSAKGLKDIGTFSKMDVYVAVSLSSDPRSEQKTPVDTDGGSSPKWNYGPMKFTLDESEVQMNRISIEFRLKHERKLMGDREVGELRVPVKELLDRAYDGRGDEPVEYPVRKHNSDKVHGSIKFSYKFGEVYKIENTAYATQRMLEPYPQPAPGNYGAPPPAGYPASGSYAPPQPAYAAPYAPPPTGYSQPPPVAGGYGYGGYQPPPPAGYPQPGYPGVYQQPGYPGAYQQPGYPGGYPGGYQQPPQKPQRGGGMGTGAAVGLGVAGGLVGGLLIGEMIDDSNDNAYDAGYDAGFDDGDDF